MSYEPQYATLDEVKHHLRYDNNDSNQILTLYLQAAETAVSNYITFELTEQTDKKAVAVAVLMLVGYYDDNRNPNSNTISDGSFLPDPIKAILSPYRKPTAI